MTKRLVKKVSKKTDSQMKDLAGRMVSAYYKRNPIRAADVHQQGCVCERCFIDFLEAYHG